MRQMRVGDTEVDIIVQGYPGKSVCHGGLGWSTLALIRTRIGLAGGDAQAKTRIGLAGGDAQAKARIGLAGGDAQAKTRIAVVDTGPFGYRPLIRQGLEKRGLTTADVTDVLLTHCHHDHSVNWVMFKDARIVIGADEMAWATKLPWGENAVPELYVAELDRWKTVVRVTSGDEVFPGMTAYLAPGHTPGCLIFVLEGPQHDLIFTGDSAKNRAELVSRDTDASYDKKVSAASIELIWSHWRKKPGTIVIPGHDTPMVLRDGVPTYVGKLEAAIKSWTGSDMETTTLFRLVM